MQTYQVGIKDKIPSINRFISPNGIQQPFLDDQENLANNTETWKEDKISYLKTKVDELQHILEETIRENQGLKRAHTQLTDSLREVNAQVQLLFITREVQETQNNSQQYSHQETQHSKQREKEIRRQNMEEKTQVNQYQQGHGEDLVSIRRTYTDQNDPTDYHDKDYDSIRVRQSQQKSPGFKASMFSIPLTQQYSHKRMLSRGSCQEMVHKREKTREEAFKTPNNQRSNKLLQQNVSQAKFDSLSYFSQNQSASIRCYQRVTNLNHHSSQENPRSNRQYVSPRYYPHYKDVRNQGSFDYRPNDYQQYEHNEQRQYQNINSRKINIPKTSARNTCSKYRRLKTDNSTKRQNKKIITQSIEEIWQNCTPQNFCSAKVSSKMVKYNAFSRKPNIFTEQRIINSGLITPECEEDTAETYEYQNSNMITQERGNQFTYLNKSNRMYAGHHPRITEEDEISFSQKSSYLDSQLPSDRHYIRHA